MGLGRGLRSRGAPWTPRQAGRRAPAPAGPAGPQGPISKGSQTREVGGQTRGPGGGRRGGHRASPETVGGTKAQPGRRRGRGSGDGPGTPPSLACLPPLAHCRLGGGFKAPSPAAGGALCTETAWPSAGCPPTEAAPPRLPQGSRELPRLTQSPLRARPPLLLSCRFLHKEAGEASGRPPAHPTQARAPRPRRSAEEVGTPPEGGAVPAPEGQGHCPSSHQDGWGWGYPRPAWPQEATKKPTLVPSPLR